MLPADLGKKLRTANLRLNHKQSGWALTREANHGYEVVAKPVVPILLRKLRALIIVVNVEAPIARVIAGLVGCGPWGAAKQCRS